MFFIETTILPWVLPMLCYIILTGKRKFDGYFIIDWISTPLLIVSIWVFFMSILSIPLRVSGAYSIFIIFRAISRRFLRGNFLIFYILFEFSFILMFIFLLRWGKNPERMQASIYILIFTLVFSLPFFIILVEISYSERKLFFRIITINYKQITWVFIILVFIVKLPVYGFHLWLPKAHVEAPVSGSIILAGVLLKLGGYGIMRFLPTLKITSPTNRVVWTLMIFTSLVGWVVVRVICRRFTDLKIVIAYSSVVHIRSIYVGLVIFNRWSEKGSLLIIVAHGFISSIIFILITFMYDFLQSRRLIVLKGVYLCCPTFRLIWFIRCSLNLGLPPFISFFSEFIIIRAIALLNFTEIVIVCLCCFFTGVYCIWIFTSISHGETITPRPNLIRTKITLLRVCHIYFVLTYPIVFI